MHAYMPTTASTRCASLHRRPLLRKNVHESRLHDEVHGLIAYASNAPPPCVASPLSFFFTPSFLFSHNLNFHRAPDWKRGPIAFVANNATFVANRANNATINATGGRTESRTEPWPASAPLHLIRHHNAAARRPHYTGPRRAKAWQTTPRPSPPPCGPLTSRSTPPACLHQRV